MLSIQKLKNFLDTVQEKIPEITRTELLSDERRFANITRSLKKDDIIFIAILPTARRKKDDEDHQVFRNKLAFLCVKRFNERDSEEKYLESFTITQQIILSFSKYLRDIKSTEKCLFRDVDIGSEMIIPVENYHQTNGWDLSITADTVV